MRLLSIAEIIILRQSREINPSYIKLFNNNHYFKIPSSKSIKVRETEFRQSSLRRRSAPSGLCRIEKRKVSITYLDRKLPEWSSVKTIIKIESERQLKYKTEFGTRYYISDLRESASKFYERIREYWGVENKVHYVRDVTQKEDKSRIRTKPLPQIMAIARNLALNLYRDAGFNNMAQAQRKCRYSLDHILEFFRMK